MIRLMENVESYSDFMQSYNSYDQTGSTTPQSCASRETIAELLRKPPTQYTHRMYANAAAIFDVLKHQYADDHMHDVARHRNAHPPQTQIIKSSDVIVLPSIRFESQQEKRKTFDLVFATLKYQKVLEQVLDSCSFFLRDSKLSNNYALVMVLMCDFRLRRFNKRQPLPHEHIIPLVDAIEDTIYKWKTRLHAAVARMRIKSRVQRLDDLLCPDVSEKDRFTCEMLIYGWVNRLKTSKKQVVKHLIKDGFVPVATQDELLGRTFFCDKQCSDMIAFSPDQRECIEDHPIVADGYFILQDKSSCIGPQCVRNLLSQGGDVLLVNVGSGVSAAHLASLTRDTHPNIYAFGVRSDKHGEQVAYNFKKFDVPSRVRLVHEDFTQTDTSDERLKNVRVALVTSECTKSAVVNPVHFIVSEGEDLGILKRLSRGATEEPEIRGVAARHIAVLKHTLYFPQMQAVIYCTRSKHSLENEEVVDECIDFINLTGTIVHNHTTHFRACPPVLPLSAHLIEREGDGRFLRFSPSREMSGCFVATLIREASESKELAKDVLARAAAHGILSGLRSESDTNAKSSRKNRKKKGSTGLLDSAPSAASVGRRAGVKSPRRRRSNVAQATSSGELDKGTIFEVERMRQHLLSTASAKGTRRQLAQNSAAYANVYSTQNARQFHPIAPPLIQTGSVTSADDSLTTSDGETTTESVTRTKTNKPARKVATVKTRGQRAPRIRLDNPPKLYAPLQPPTRPPKPQLHPKPHLFPPQVRGGMERTTSDSVLRLSQAPSGTGSEQRHTASIPSKHNVFCQNENGERSLAFDAGRGSR